jgi:exonuclease III
MAVTINEKTPISILSLNARGLCNCTKKANLFHWLDKHHKVHEKIMFIQETHVTKDKESWWSKTWHGPKFFSNGTSRSKGVAILLPKCLEYTLHSEILDPNGRYVVLKLEIDNIMYGFINGYAPTSDMLEDQLAWLESITVILENLGDVQIIFGGDINDGLTKLDKFLDRREWKPSEYVLGWRALKKELQLVDIWRILNPTAHRYTWKQGKCKKTLRRSRLDFWLISTSLIYGVEKTNIEPGYGSDHSLISLSLFKKKLMDQGPSFWKFNTSLLRDKVYTDTTTIKIAELKEKYSKVRDHGLRWDLIKMGLRMGTISYSKYIAKKKRDNIKELLIKQGDLEVQISDNPTDEILEQSEKIKEEIECYNREKTMGALIRSKAEWAEYGEKNCNYFLRLENRNKQIKNISSLLDDDGKTIDSQDKILAEELKYYAKLYTQPTETCENDRNKAKNFFLEEDIPKVSNEDKQMCDQVLTLEEVGRALKDLKNGRTPGTDGFPPDFYKFFWKDIGVLVYDSLNNAINKGEMSIDQKRGIINLIPKKEKDLRQLKNWRPISLLNTDYKILTKTMATRLKFILPSVIHPDQVAYLKNRYIGQNIRTIIDIMDFTKDNEKDGIMAFFDFEKAFDSIDWRVIDDALNSFNIGENFRKWVKTIYNNITSCVTNCGYSSEHFTITRGVRQGCPLSAYLFIIVAEILAIKIRNNNNIHGIKIGETEIKVVQMADDTTSFLRDVNSLQEIMNTLEEFRKYAGLRLNKTKSEIMWLGKQKDSNEMPCGLKCVKGTKALGIFFTYNLKEMVEKNFDQKIKELKKILAIWSQRDLSIIGRILIFKSLALSKVIYQCNNLEIPEDTIKELNQLAFTFIWQNKPDKVKRNTIISDYENGGLRMIDVECFINAQKVMWVKRILKEDTGSWKTYPNMILQKVAGKKSFQCNTNKIEKENIWSPFYKQVYKSWTKIRDEPLEDPFKLRREILWWNKEIAIKKKEMFFKKWFEGGITTFHDILEEDGNFKTKLKLEEEFNIQIGIMDYNSLKLAIPTAWKRNVKKMRIPENAISNLEQPFIKCKNNLLALGIITNKDVYWELISKKEIKPIVAQKWCERYEIGEQEWKVVFKNFAEIKDPKLKAFQFKILNNIIPCNWYLKKIGRSNTEECPSCNEIEDLVHYFVGCHKANNIWLQIRRWWKGITGQEVVFTERDIILGLENRKVKIIKQEQLNKIMMSIKWKIHANKQLGQETLLYQILNNIRQMIRIEEIIAAKNDKHKKHQDLWTEVEDFLT